MSDVDDLPARLAKCIAVESVSGCWLWQGRPDGGGFGQTRWGREQGRSPHVQVHRLVFHRLVDQSLPVAPGRTRTHDIEQTCREKLCCNPSHLQAVPTRKRDK